MRVLDIDWTDLFAFTGVWDELAPHARALILELGPREPGPAPFFAEHIDQLVAAGMLELFKDGEDVRATEAFRPALEVLRLMRDVPLFQTLDVELIEEYYRRTLSNEERAALIQDDVWSVPEVFLPTVGSTAWIEGFLACKDHARWEAERLPNANIHAHFHKTSAVALLAEPRAGKDVCKLLRMLMSQPAPFAFGELGAAVGRMGARRLADAVLASLRYALAMVGFDADLRPTLGLHPAISARLHRRLATPPAPVEPDESVCLPWMLEDVVQLLVFTSEPRRLRSNDAQLFAKAERELEELLITLPVWVFERGAKLARAQVARMMAEEQGWVQVGGHPGSTYRLEITEPGRRWLGLSPHERAREFYAPQRLQQAVDADAEWIAYPSYYEVSAADQASSFEGLEGPVLLVDFLRHRAEVTNPLLENRTTERSQHGSPPTEGVLEELWSARLVEIVAELLAPNGGVRLGRKGDAYTFELNDIGHYLLGRTDTLSLPESQEQVAILVQPDFEIVFLAANPALEAHITRFAERIGRGVGALFRLTRISVQAASRAGISAEDILSTLGDACQVELPPNVVHELKGWCGQTIQLKWEVAHILRCPDEETAARVLSASKGKLELASPTVLVLVDRKKRSVITNACRKAGVFIDLPEEEAVAKKKPKRRRSWGW